MPPELSSFLFNRELAPWHIPLKFALFFPFPHFLDAGRGSTGDQLVKSKHGHQCKYRRIGRAVAPPGDFCHKLISPPPPPSLPCQLQPLDVCLKDILVKSGKKRQDQRQQILMTVGEKQFWPTLQLTVAMFRRHNAKSRTAYSRSLSNLSCFGRRCAKPKRKKINRKGRYSSTESIKG